MINGLAGDFRNILLSIAYLEEIESFGIRHLELAQFEYGFRTTEGLLA